jgi:hypothetical protein
MQSSAKRPRNEEHGRDKPIFACCKDGEVVISESEFDALVDAGNVLKYLVYGHYNMAKRETPQFDVFRQFNIVVMLLTHSVVFHS